MWPEQIRTGNIHIYMNVDDVQANRCQIGWWLVFRKLDTDVESLNDWLSILCINFYSWCIFMRSYGTLMDIWLSTETNTFWEKCILSLICPDFVKYPKKEVFSKMRPSDLLLECSEARSLNNHWFVRMRPHAQYPPYCLTVI